MADVASAIRELARSALASDDQSISAMQAPEARRASAIHLLEDDGDFSDYEQVEVIQLFKKSIDTADTFLAISKQEVRTKFIRAELHDRN